MDVDEVIAASRRGQASIYAVIGELHNLLETLRQVCANFQANLALRGQRFSMGKGAGCASSLYFSASN